MANNKYTVMSEEAIRYICGLIKNIVSLPSEIISNTNLSDNLTFSNIHIKDLVDQCLIDAKDYVDLIYGSLIKLTCEKTTVQPTLDNSQINVIYLYSADGNAPFQQYLKISETELIDMGSTTISLTDYLTATQIASAYVKQIDFNTLTTSFNNLVTSVENKIDKDKIVAVLDDTVTDEQVPSAKVVYDSVKDNNVKTYYNLSQLGLTTGHTVQDVYMAMDEGSMAMIAVVGASCTDAPDEHGVLVIEKQNTGKVNIVFKQSYNDSVAPNCVWIGTLKGSDGTGLTWNKVLSMEEKTYMEAVVIEDVLDPIIENADILFHSTSNTGSLVNLTGQKLFCVECRKRVFSTKEIMLTQTAYQPSTGKLIATRSKNWWDSTWSAWNLVCTTKVADVNETKIEIDETALELTIADNKSSYKVVNGICYVTFEINVVPPTDDKTYRYTKINTTTLPKIGFSTKAVLNVIETSNSISLVLDKGSSSIKLHGNILGREGSCILQGSFSYPVAE